MIVPTHQSQTGPASTSISVIFLATFLDTRWSQHAPNLTNVLRKSIKKAAKGSSFFYGALFANRHFCFDAVFSHNYLYMVSLEPDIKRKFEPLAALFMLFLSTLVKLGACCDHLVSRKVAKKVTEIDVDARPI